MNTIDLGYLRTWTGKTRTDEDLISERHSRLMAATFDYSAADEICDGECLPPLWHWAFFLVGHPSSELGRDGYPARGGFMPPVPLPNRMWAGGRVMFEAPVHIGSTIRKESSIQKVDHKQGKSGDLVFVTVLHELTSLQGDILIREEQDIVLQGFPSIGQVQFRPASTGPISIYQDVHTYLDHPVPIFGTDLQWTPHSLRRGLLPGN